MKVPIFYYHSIGGPGPQTLPMDLFRLQLDFLLEEGYTTITFRDLLEGGAERVRDPSNGLKLAVLTFDDGLLDNFENAFPELTQRGMTGTFFVVPGYDYVTRYVNPDSRRWSDRKQPGYTIEFKSMTSEHRRALARGGMEIGGHTMTHRNLTRVPPSEHHRELVESKLQLESELGTPVDTFCYPFGGANPAIRRSVEAAGYLGAAGTFPGYEGSAPADRFRCRRFLIHNPYYFREILRGRAFSPAAFVRSARVFGRWRFFQ